jgi:HK97 family phage prohead protease
MKIERRKPMFVRENLYRGLQLGAELRHRAPVVSVTRSDDDAELGGNNGTDGLKGTVMAGYFAVFNTWTEICSWYEGDFLEMIQPGAFAKTISENLDAIKVQFDHGYDVEIGDALLGPIDLLEEDDIGAAYEVPLLDTDYNRDRVLPMLQGRLMNGDQRGSLLGASFRFKVMRDEWVEDPGVSPHNPENMPERTIKEVQLFEFGPVVFPAYPEATAASRSLTDHFLDRAKQTRSLNRPAPSPAGSSTGDVAPSAPARSHPETPQPSGLLLASAITQLEKIR